MTELTRVSGVIWEHFCRLIENVDIQNKILNADSFDKICQILEELNIPGIGDDTIISIAAKLAYDFDKPIDDSCFRCHFIKHNSKMRYIVRHFHTFDEIRNASPLLLNFSNKDLFLLLILSKSRIVKLLRLYDNNKNLI